MNVLKYLERLGINEKPTPSLITLNKLQELHLKTIPFENLDIHNKTKIVLDIESISEKIIFNNRGGFCYELNGLFFELLKLLGFEVQRISAKVFNKDNGYGEEFDHMAILTKFDKQEYLVDVGFGEFTMLPLKFELSRHQLDRNGTFYFDKFDDDYFRVNKLVNDESIPQYIFTKQARELEEFDLMCKFHQSSGQSHFTKKKMITLSMDDGRITLTDDKFKIRDGQHLTEIKINNEDEFVSHLNKYFKIKINQYEN